MFKYIADSNASGLSVADDHITNFNGHRFFQPYWSKHKKLYLFPLIEKASDHILTLALTASVTMKSSIAEITGFGISAI
jgi:hypothetical protein